MQTMREHERIRKFVAELESQSRRLESAAQGEGLESTLLVREALREIEQALEELQVSEEELRASHESLAHSQAQLEVERLRYMDLFHSAPDAYIVTDPAGVIREANHAACALLGVSAAFLQGKPLAVCVAEADRRRFRGHLRRAAERGVSGELDVTVSRRGGELVPVALRVGTRLDAAGEVAELRCLLRDLSERRRAEEQARLLEEERRARRDAERANQIKSEFLSTVSHELRTPLTTIMAYTELLSMGIPVPLPEEAKKPLGYVDEAARHLLVLIEEILGFARVEAGREEVQAAPVDAAELLEEVANFVRPLADKNGLALRVDTRRLQGELLTDRGKLRQVLINLASNAVKFTRQGEVRLEGETREGSVLFRVQDTGIGISESDLLRVFDPFWQARQDPTRVAGGTGLGLAICHRFAELLGGELEASSVLGVGSCFSLRLPLLPSAAADAPAPQG